MNEKKPTSDLFVPGEVICQWVYNKSKGKDNTTRKRVGYVVAAKDDNNVIEIGWSKCSQHDNFDLDLAREIAYGRLMTGSNATFPAAFKAFMPEFILRCKKYFRSDEVIDFKFYSDERDNWDQGSY